MKNEITQKEIGNRIALLRKYNGLSQVDLAKLINLSRSSLAQIELGKRNLTAIELHNFSMVLKFSIDSFMNNDFRIDRLKESALDKKLDKRERVSVPKIQIPKFKNVLLYILEKCAGKPNVGETLLYKLLYFSDFNYYELYEEHLTGATYRKLPYGPVPQKLDAIINSMIKDEVLQRISTQYHGYPQKRYIPLAKSDLTQLKASEKEVLDKVIDQYSDWTATAISEYSHKDMPWLASEDGKDINYELVFYREAPYSVRNYNEKE